MTRSARRRRVRPPQAVVLGFLTAIAVGTVLLALPLSHAPGMRLTLSDALFMATSAVCVTGLIVVDPGTALSPLGEAVLLLLIKTGGLGVLSVGALVAFTLGRRLGVADRLGLQVQTNRLQVAGVVRFVRALVLVTTGIELLGALALWPGFAREAGWTSGAWLALFHSVSAWNNAGFSLFADSLVGFVADPAVALVVVALFVAGGLGLVVVTDVGVALRARFDRGRAEPGRVGRRRVPLTLHTRLALATTGALVVLGIVGIAMLEWRNPATLGALPWPARLIAAVFQGLTPRTAGFNVVDVAAMTPPGQAFTSLLMFVGGNPGSTAGGVKTTTVAVLLLAAIAVGRGRGDAVVYGRTLGAALVGRAAALATWASAVLVVAVVTLGVTDPDVPFGALAFEAVSAFGTVGLSMGATPLLSEAGRLIIVALMFVGRVGLLTLALAVAEVPVDQVRRYPREDVVIG
ncbi:MAG: potassium transporter TrkG [Trueperaceae bacterium]|nr:potassium transporter TrkG [Trueperaceae bacterium]